MTGDNSEVNYNEVEVMRQTASTSASTIRYRAGLRGVQSWDSCYRAHDVFGLTDATLVTQRFHLPRALFVCEQLGVNPVGVVADNSLTRPYQ